MSDTRSMTRSRLFALCCTATLCVVAAAAPQPAPRAPQPEPLSAPVDLKYDFAAAARPGYTHVAPTTVYSDSSGFGFEPGAHLSAGDQGQTVTSDQPFYFSAKVPEGNYTVTVTFGDSAAPTTSTFKAEAGRLMLLRVQVPAGQVATRAFTTNVRTAALAPTPLNAPGRDQVSLNQFDRANALDWDDRLTIEVVSPHAALRTLEIASAPDAPTVYIAGDSTVTDRDSGGDVSWGQMLPVFFRPGVAIANNAQSGETLKSFAYALRFDKILSRMRPGDYLFLQFGHNDSKITWPQNYAAADSTYQDYLRAYIDEARLRGATPVLVTPMDRGDRHTGAPTHSLDAYASAMRQLAAQMHVALIDLNAMSDTFYEHAGADAPAILADGTHSTAYGGYEFARAIATGIQQDHLPLASFLVPDFQPFDPAHPDSRAALNLDPLFTGVAPPTPPPAGIGLPTAAGQPASNTHSRPVPANPGPGPL